MPSNRAAYITATGAPLEVKSAPYPSPKANEIIVKNAAIAINPVDWATQALGTALFPWLFHPYITGSDLSGTVVKIGSSVTRFKEGDRVLAMSSAWSNQNNAEAAFQEYTTVLDSMATVIPASMAFEDAAVLPLGLCVASTGLFQPEYLALEYPSLSPKSTSKALLIWGGATSMGSNAIQLAVAAGYEVITTASPKNFEYVKKLGASSVFNYNSSSIVNDLLAAFKGKTAVGALDCIGGDGASEACASVLSQTNGAKFIAACKPPPGNLPEGITAKFISSMGWGTTEVGKMMFEDFIPKALAQGKYLAKPEPVIAGRGLESVQAGIDLWKKGVSASKVVVLL